jgi:hypothetical protein
MYPRLVSLLACLMALAPVRAQSYQLGVYYFPGWKAEQKGNAYLQPWEKIKPFPERKPVLGWYSEDQPGVMRQQLQWMHNYGLSFVVFDWLWGSDGQAYLAHGVNSYLAEPNKYAVDFAILWANHTDYIYSEAQFAQLFNFWAQRYFFKKEYVKIGGKPVIFIFSAQVLANNAKKIGLSVPQLVAMADAQAKKAGLPGVIFAGGIGGNAGANFDYSAKGGFAAFSAYNFHGPATKSYAPGRHESHTFAELDDAYQDHWRWMLDNTAGLYIVPIASGWDKRPWGGSKDPQHDNSRPTPTEFKSHLQAAKKLLDQNTKTQGMGVICCWNEYGEGSYIEPTQSQGTKMLEQIRQVFF